MTGRTFTIGEDGYFDPYGRVLQDDLCVALFSVFHVPVDVGFIRTRVTADIDETGVRDTDSVAAITHFFIPSSGDEYAFYFNNCLFTCLDLNMILSDAFSSFSPRLGIPALLRVTGLTSADSGFGRIFKKGDLWGHFSEDETLLGADFEISDYPAGRASAVQEKPGASGFGGGISVRGEYELQEQAYSSCRVEAGAGTSLIALTLAGSYLRDPLLEPYGMADGIATGGRLSGEIYPYRGLVFSGSVGLNFIDDIKFMTGAAGHLVYRISVIFRI